MLRLEIFKQEILLLEPRSRDWSDGYNQRWVVPDLRALRERRAGRGRDRGREREREREGERFGEPARGSQGMMGGTEEIRDCNVILNLLVDRLWNGNKIDMFLRDLRMQRVSIWRKEFFSEAEERSWRVVAWLLLLLSSSSLSWWVLLTARLWGLDSMQLLVPWRRLSSPMRLKRSGLQILASPLAFFDSTFTIALCRKIPQLSTPPPPPPPPPPPQTRQNPDRELRHTKSKL